MEQNYINNLELSKDSFNIGLFTGQYVNQGGEYYLNQQTQLLIKVCERKQPTTIKPRFYVVHRTQDNKFVFISSLYPQELENTFIAENRKQYFIVKKEGQSINITAK
jgi:hypothetical protein